MSRHFDLTLYRRASWGPLHLVETGGQVRATVPGSGTVTIEAPYSEGVEKQGTLSMLTAGLPVTVDGVRRFLLRQDAHGLARRAGRVIRVDAADLLPPDAYLRARWFHSMGLETGDPSGSHERLIRPVCDALQAPALGGLTIGRPQVAQSVGPDVIAMWGAAQWHLMAAVHR